MAPRHRLRSVSRKDSPLSPAKAPPAAITPDASSQNKRKTRSSSREITTAQQELQNIETIIPPTVHEADEEIPDPVEEVAEVDTLDSSLPYASSTGSSQQELVDALDRDTIIDNLQILYDDSIALISFFEAVDENALRQTCAALLQPNPRVRRLFQTKVKRFLDTREGYGGNHYGENAEFVRPDIVNLKLLGTTQIDVIPSGTWRPDGVLFIANLALQLVKVASSSADDHRDYLEFVFGNFPEPFLEYQLFPISAEASKETLDFMVEILTQVYISKVEEKFSEPHFDPDDELDEVFFDEDGTVKGSSEKATHAKTLNRIETIRSFFNVTAPQHIDIEAFRNEFPWSDFVVRVAKWSVARKEELCKMIELKGGMEKLIDLLQAGNFEADTPQPHGDGGDLETADLVGDIDEQESPSEVSAQEADEASANHRFVRMNARGASHQEHGAQTEEPVDAQMPAAGIITDVKAMRSQLNNYRAAKALSAAHIPGANTDLATDEQSESGREIAQSPTPALDNGGEVADIDDNQVPNIDEEFEQPQSPDQVGAPDETEEVVATQLTNIVMQTIRRQNEQSNKENKATAAKKVSLLDPQEGAERLEWDENFGDEDMPPPRRSPKRSRLQTQDDSDEDETAFEKDTRTTKRARVNVAERTRRPLATTHTRFEDVEDDAESVDGDGNGKKVQPRALTSRTRNKPSRSRQAEASASPGPARRKLPFSSSQPADLRIQGFSSSSRAPLQPIPSSNRGLPSSSAPSRSARTTNPSSLPTPACLPPSHQAPPRSRHLPSPSEEPPRTQVVQVNREAKERVRMARDLAQNRQPAQSRKAYSVEEVERLMEMIELYGTKWARILQEDGAHEEGAVLQRRSQVQLKDKARNLKIDFLK